MILDRHRRVGMLQMRMGPEPTDNLVKAAGHLGDAARAGFQLVVLPELFRSRYFCQTHEPSHFDLAEGLDGPTVTSMQEVARETQLVLVVPFFERAQAGVYYNSAVVIESDGQVVGHYRKMHIPDDPGFHEKFYFRPGNLGFPVFDTSVGRIGVLICWDQWFPEAARALALAGAEIVCVPTAIGTNFADTCYGADQRDRWLAVQRGHAIANQVFWVAANRVGFEPNPGAVESREGLTFWGHSMIYGPTGVMSICAEHWAGGVVGHECNLADIERTRRHWPFLRDRRTDAYEGLVRP